jgi:TPP-dependent pyruvate/acetoin dehydrogenase alpha subunit
MKMQRTGAVAVCFFGDGATNEGAFHEGLNFAAVQHLPIVFVCENNLYGASTRFDKVSLVPDVVERAKAYGVAAHLIDGMDVLAVRQASDEAVALVRRGIGPILLECKTYRFTGHSRSDARGYRTREEEEDWASRDPLIQLAPHLNPGIADEIEGDVANELQDAVEFARMSPDPDPSELWENVYA